MEPDAHQAADDSDIRAREGRCEGRLPYGKKPGEDKVVARMLELKAQRLNIARITELINSQFRPRTGKRFYPANVARILNKSLAPNPEMTPRRVQAG